VYDVHPEFGYFCPAPRIRRELRVALFSILIGIMIGAAIVTVRASRAVETDGVSSNARLKSSVPDTLAVGVAAPGSNADSVKADPGEAIESYPMRMVRVRPSTAASTLAGIAPGHTAPSEPEIAPAPAGPASPEKIEGSKAPAASPRAQSFAALVGINKGVSTRPRARRQWDGENENEAWQNRRRRDWSDRRYAEDRYWRGGYRDWGSW
jgi:hypothetical protein